MRVEQDVYDMELKNTKRIIKVKHLAKKKQAVKHLYYWKPGETFADMTPAKLRRSRELADILNRQEQQMYPRKMHVCENQAFKTEPNDN